MIIPSPSVVARLEAVRKTYGVESPRIALDGVDLSVVEGDFIAAIGPAGCGTSTLLKVLGGLETAIEGRAYLGETEITGMGESDIAPLRRRHVGFVWPLDLVPTLDVLSNIRLPFTRSGQPMRPAEDDRVRDLIASFGLQEHRFRFPHELSGCHERRVAIARALAPVPRMVLADDPTGDLDARSGDEVVALFRASAHEFGQAIVMSTHDPLAASQADRVVFLADGVIVGERRGLGSEEIRHAVRVLEGAA